MQVPLVCVEIPKNTSVLKFVPRYEAPLLLLLWRGADGIVTQYDPGNPVKIIPHPTGYTDKEMFWRTIESFDQEFERLVREYDSKEQKLVERLYPTRAKWEEACVRSLQDADVIRRAQMNATKAEAAPYVADPAFESLIEEHAEELAALGITIDQVENAAQNMDAVGISDLKAIRVCPLLKLTAVPSMPLALAQWLKKQLPTPENGPDLEARDSVPLPIGTASPFME